MRYHRLLRRYVRRPAGELAPGAGSVVTTEYVDPLLEILGEGCDSPPTSWTKVT